MVLNKQLILIYDLNIYFGNINNDKSKYVPEIMIFCRGANELNRINNELMNETINIVYCNLLKEKIIIILI